MNTGELEVDVKCQYCQIWKCGGWCVIEGCMKKKGMRTERQGDDDCLRELRLA